jgi:hypothetical protein
MKKGPLAQAAEWIARQGMKLDRSDAIRRLVEIELKAKK